MTPKKASASWMAQSPGGLGGSERGIQPVGEHCHLAKALGLKVFDEPEDRGCVVHGYTVNRAGSWEVNVCVQVGMHRWCN